ncbi:MAG: hypothetical protein C4576_06475 [Desulfobacteraceae bacterium]|nr:MAG: hypothetical protein C4576_06475 [Desulfobacteraceae bacterium]
MTEQRTLERHRLAFPRWSVGTIEKTGSPVFRGMTESFRLFTAASTLGFGRSSSLPRLLCLLPAVNCSLLTVYCSLLTAYCLLLTAHFLPPTSSRAVCRRS